MPGRFRFRMIEIDENLSIPDSEVTFTASRSGGPGGQNVNKVSSRITLQFTVPESTALSDEQKEKILERLASRISGEGILQVSSRQHRSQLSNKEEATARFAELIREALQERPIRKKTKPARAAKVRRLNEKRKRGEIKRLRSDPGD